jgi:EKC/KEOPS complex subunit CGI121/TPRKB
MRISIADMPHALARTYPMPQSLEGEERFATLALVNNVTNCAHLRSQASAGLIEAALLNPRLLCSEFHVLTAVNKAVMRRADNQMKTKNIYSEIIYNLSPSTNISDSFKNFGIRDDSTDVLVVLLISDPLRSVKVNDVLGIINGEVVSLENIAEMNDTDAIKKVYKISKEECAITSLENSVATRIATRDVL